MGTSYHLSKTLLYSVKVIMGAEPKRKKTFPERHIRLVVYKDRLVFKRPANREIFIGSIRNMYFINNRIHVFVGTDCIIFAAASTITTGAMDLENTFNLLQLLSGLFSKNEKKTEEAKQVINQYVEQRKKFTALLILWLIAFGLSGFIVYILKIPYHFLFIHFGFPYLIKRYGPMKKTKYVEIATKAWGFMEKHQTREAIKMIKETRDYMPLNLDFLYDATKYYFQVDMYGSAKQASKEFYDRVEDPQLKKIAKEAIEEADELLKAKQS